MAKKTRETMGDFPWLVLVKQEAMGFFRYLTLGGLDPPENDQMINGKFQAWMKMYLP